MLSASRPDGKPKGVELRASLDPLDLNFGTRQMEHTNTTLSASSGLTAGAGCLRLNVEASLPPEP